jgi:hypothetical protein
MGGGVMDPRIIGALALLSEALTARSVQCTGLCIWPPEGHVRSPESRGQPVALATGSIVLVHATSGHRVRLDDLGAGQEALAQSVINSLALVPHTPKSHWELFNELAVLTGDQLSRAWNSIAEGWPNALQLDQSPYASVFNLADWLSRTSTAFNPYELDELKRRILGMWVLSQPFYLFQNPEVGSDIVILGYRAAAAA